MRDLVIAITAASFSGNKGAAAMLKSSIRQLHDRYGEALQIRLMSSYPKADREQNPFEFVKVVSCKPERILFIAFPLAVAYKLLGWLPPVRKALGRNKILKAFAESDLVLDEAGVAFVDSRGFVMNTYAFVTNAVPMLMGTKVVKYSQALGSFNSAYNRFLAKWILPKIELICARGEMTRENLAGIGVTKNVKLCADGAFSMTDDEDTEREVRELMERDGFFSKPFCTLSVSSVVEAKCAKMNIDYAGTMSAFADELTKKGYGVLLIANAARLGSEKPRNNDLPVCDRVYASVKNKDKIKWYHEEMTPEKIRTLIGYSEVLIASRFHAMIAALERSTPVFLIGWSHKYQEVLDMFGLGAWATDFRELTLASLVEKFDDIILHKTEIEQALHDGFPAVKESSLDNIRAVSAYIDGKILPVPKRVGLLDMNRPERYIGSSLACRVGYSTDEGIRRVSASGGMVTTLLCSLLREGEIDGAWVSRSHVENGNLTYKSWIATTEEEIKSCPGSIYMEMPLMREAQKVSDFDGRIAVVLLPCEMRAFDAWLSGRPDEERSKVVLRIALYCSGSHDPEATRMSLRKRGVDINAADRVIFRRGIGRGHTFVEMKDGTTIKMSYSKTLCAYKNAFFFAEQRCLLCQDHFGRSADLSFGDIWLKEMMRLEIKHTSCIIRSENGRRMYDVAVKKGDITDRYFSRSDLLKSQKRALVFKYNCAAAKVAYYAKEGKRVNLDTDSRCKLRHRLAYYLARTNKRLSVKNPKFVEHIPLGILYYYMCFVRFLLN